MIAKKLLTTIAFAFVLLFSGCAKDDFEEVDGVCPLVISTVPTSDAVGVPLNQVITATFNEVMKSSTITTASFLVSANGAQIAGKVSYTGSTATFTPNSPLLPNTKYTGTITTLASDPRGNFLQENYVWSFTTLKTFTVGVSPIPTIGGVTAGGGTFNEGTTVTLTATAAFGYDFANWTEGGVIVPGAGASYQFVLIGNRTLVANFIVEPPLQFTVILSGNPQAGGSTNGGGTFNAGSLVTVTANANAGYTFVNWTENGIIVPGANATYEFVIANDRTLQANFMLNAVASGECPTPSVNLGLAKNYAILAESGISTTGTTYVTGNMGISPSAATFITGFALNLTAGAAYSTSSLVTGNIYAPGYADPTPANLTTAVDDMHTAFTTANGLPADVTELMAGNLNGQTLVSGVYKWGTGLSVTNSITLNGGGVDCAKFIFQISGDLTVANGTNIILTNGAKADNIYWVVAGSGAMLGTTVDFKGNILSKTLISVNTGSKVDGRLLAQTAVTLNASSIVKP
ncbi:MAG: ice-binding family protein [Lutibacter sp.]|nr:ice-binding family protein [Lutibacter sp.]MDP3359328.1 ice-binding family protein [Lutibacter sp.]